jgi:hypothetical protein
MQSLYTVETLCCWSKLTKTKLTGPFLPYICNPLTCIDVIITQKYTTDSKNTTSVYSKTYWLQYVPCFHIVFTLLHWNRGVEAPSTILSRVLPLQPLGHQAARYGAHVLPLLRAPAHHQTHLDSITSLITFPIYVTPFGSYSRCHCFCFSSLSMRCLWFVLYCV